MKKRLLKKGIAAIMFAAIAAGSMATIVHGAPENSPGRLALDIGSDFTEASRSGDGKKDLEKKSEGAEYELTCYTRLLSDHDEDGITYRTTDQYDMTDVTDVEFSAYTKTEAAGDSGVSGRDGDRGEYVNCSDPGGFERSGTVRGGDRGRFGGAGGWLRDRSRGKNRQYRRLHLL